jgi:Rad3-related DNA helicase
MDLYNYEWEHQQYWSLQNHPPRPEQKQIINEIIDAIDMGFKNIIIEAGTGTGKSAIATTIANYVGDSYILTMTKQLQNQYLDDFEYMLSEIKGTSNYTCNIRPTSCDDCLQLDNNRGRHYNCKYKQAIETAKEYPCVITNYDYLFYAGNYAEVFAPRELIVLDESHNLEKKIMHLIGKTLNRQMIFKHYGLDIFYPITEGKTLKSIDNVDYWVNTLHELEVRARSNAANAPNRKNRELYTKDKLKFQYLITQLENEEAKFIIELPSKKDILNDKKIKGKFENGLKAEFKPLTISDYSEQLLKFGDIRLFMTGTLGSKEKFCQWIGIDQKETYYIYVKSPFAKEHRPIIKSYVGSMSGRNGRNPNWRNAKAIQKIKEIMSKHTHDKGVIHTSSNQQAWFVKKMLNSKTVWVAQGPTREDTIKRFEHSKQPIVLVGAGLKDGVDFKGDKCRYQILFKMPYPSLAGKQVNIRMHYDPTWYAYQTIMPLMQSYGRGIRDVDDYCVMYVIDSDFDRLLKKYEYLFNEYFLEAIKGNDGPRPIPKPIRVNGA